MKLGVVVPCYRQERFLPRTVAALERALEGRDWQATLVLAAPAAEPLPALSPRWQLLAPPGRPRRTPAAPLTPGGARMLGCAACGGEWVLFVDADVEVERAWLDAALEAAERERGGRLAGLWGRLEEWFVTADGEWAGNPDLHGVGREERGVEYLTTPAFYCREALIGVGGYDTRLSSEEDFELGLRLRGRGFELRSLAALAARHWSAPRPSFGELGRRWRQGLCFGQGQVLRIYAGRPGFATLLRRQALYLATLAMWALGLAALALTLAGADVRPVLAWLSLLLIVLATMALRKRSPRLALHSLLTWTLNGFGLLVGLVRLPRPLEPRQPVGEAVC
jgi:hypothetical protein